MSKILLVNPSCDGNDVGEALSGFQWASRLSKCHDVTLLTLTKTGAEPASIQLPNSRVIEWPEPAFLGHAERLSSMMKPGYVAFYIRARRWIKNRLREGETFDIAHQTTPLGLRYPSPAAGLGLPLVIGPIGGSLSSPPDFANSEGSSPWYTKLRAIDQFRLRWDPLLRSTYRSADCVLGIGTYVEQVLGSIPLRCFQVMSDTGLNQIPAPIDRSTRIGPVKLLYVGRLVRTKGAQDVIRAMALITDLPIALDIVGEGPEREICESLVTRNNLGDRVSLHGRCSKAAVFEFYKQADIFVFPSYREPGGNVVPEAMSFSLPLIVVDRGGPGSATNELCAIKLRVSTPDQLVADLAAAIRRLATDGQLRNRMGTAAREHAGKTALWSSKLIQMEEIYDRVMATRQRSLKKSPCGIVECKDAAVW